MGYKLIAFIVICVLSAVVLQKVLDAYQRENTDFQDPCMVVRSHKYHCEEHMVVTEDGYKLTAHRIPYGRNSKNKNPNKEPVLLMHGAFVSSAFWTIGPPDLAYGYLLADAGYDVWMGNMRGNRYSLGHKTLSTTDRAYWQFSYEDTGTYDIPAFIDYTLNKTGAEKLHYIGHSMGGGNFFIAMSRRPEYNSKIRLMVALVPGVYAKEFTSYLGTYCPAMNVIRTVTESFGRYSFASYNAPLSTFLYTVSGNRFILPITKFLWANFFGSQDLFHLETALGFFARFPAGLSLNMAEQLCQFQTADEFRALDFKSDELNRQRYGQSKPPAYDLSKVTSPVLLFRADSDNIISPTNVDRLSKELPNLVKYITVDHPAFNHIDFALAKEAPKLVLEPVLKYMKQY